MGMRRERGCKVTRRAFGGVVFDMDGTLVNSEHIHKEAWLATLPDYGINLAPDGYEATFSGRPGLDIARYVLGFPLPEAEALIERVRTAFWQIAPGRIEIMPGVERILERFQQTPKAVATSARREDARRVLEMTGLGRWFDAVVAVDDVQQGKPHPEPFRMAAERLGVDPRGCLAFEDAPNGLRSARGAGMYCIGIGPDRDLLAPHADLVIGGYGDESLWAVIGADYADSGAT